MEKERPENQSKKDTENKKNLEAEWTKGSKQRAKPIFGLVPEFNHNLRQERKTEDCREKNSGAARKSQENKGGPEEKLVKNR